MTDTLTRIRLPGLPTGEGYLDWGVRSAEDMIAIMRHRADHMRMVVAAIDAAADADFMIDVVRGSVIQRHVRNVQPGNPHQLTKSLSETITGGANGWKEVAEVRHTAGPWHVEPVYGEDASNSFPTIGSALFGASAIR